MREVYKYIVKKNITIFDRLFLDGDIIYLETCDPSNGTASRVFMDDRKLIGKLSYADYWKLKDNLEIIKSDARLD